MGLLCAVCLVMSGCSDPIMNSGIAHSGNQPANQPGNQSGASQLGSNPVPEVGDVRTLESSQSTPAQQTGASQIDSAEASTNSSVGAGVATGSEAGQSDGARPRAFSVEGPQGAVRVNFDDLDLMKHLNMDSVTPDCIDKMPAWLKDLDGKMVRVRGFMKPSAVIEGIPAFVFVRSTDLCCFGPKGKVYHLIAVTLKPGLTTDYIELKPFDVVGKFRIEIVQLDEGLIFLLYHIDDAAIIRS